VQSDRPHDGLPSVAGQRDEEACGNARGIETSFAAMKAVIGPCGNVTRGFAIKSSSARPRSSSAHALHVWIFGAHVSPYAPADDDQAGDAGACLGG
jgi:hypothetical protein